MSTTFSVHCTHCGNPVIISVEEGFCGGVQGVCRRCSHWVNVSYSYSNGKLVIYNIL